MGKADKPEKNNNKQKHFWKDFKAELKKVIWPTRSQVINNTIIVLVIVVIVTAICFVLDLAFEALNTYGIDNLKSIVQSNVSDNNTVGNNVIDTNNVVENTTNNVEDNNSVADETAQDTTEINNVSE